MRLLCLRGLAAQTLTPVRVRHGRSGLKPSEYLRQLPLKYVEFGNLLLDTGVAVQSVQKVSVSSSFKINTLESLL